MVFLPRLFLNESFGSFIWQSMDTDVVTHANYANDK